MTIDLLLEISVKATLVLLVAAAAHLDQDAHVAVVLDNAVVAAMKHFQALADRRGLVVIALHQLGLAQVAHAGDLGRLRRHVIDRLACRIRTAPAPA